MANVFSVSGFSLWLSILLFAALIHSESTALASVVEIDQEEEDDNGPEEGCALYLAVVPSVPLSPELKKEEGVLHAEDRWSLFLGREMPEGQVIDIIPDVSLPLWEFGKLYVPDEDNELQQAIISILYEYMWGGYQDASVYEFGPEQESMSLIPGVALMTTLESREHAIINTLLRNNVKFDILSSHKRHMPFQENGSLNQGGYSAYFNVTVATTDFLEAGTELLLPTLTDEEEEDTFLHDPEKIVEEHHYEMLQGLGRQIQSFFVDKHADLEDSAKEKMYQFLVTDYLQAGLGKRRSMYVRNNILPPDYESFKGQFVSQQEGSLLFGEQPSLEWLENHATCVDQSSTFRPGLSLIQNAGQGLFASSDFATSERISIVPVLPIPEKDILDYELNGERKQQLMYNYCYGHTESNILLFPVAPGVNYINHQPGDRANAKLEWLIPQSPYEERWMRHQERLVQMHPYEILLDLFRPRGGIQGSASYTGFPAVGGLILQIVATRDIREGEEIYLDYGQEFEDALQTYLTSEQESPPVVSLKAAHLNHEYLNKPFPTLEDEPIAHDELMANAMLMAFVPFGRERASEVRLDDRQFVFSINSKAEEESEELSSLEYHITVSNPLYGEDDDEPARIEVDVRHEQFFFVQRPEGSDSFYASRSFRHFIGLPSDMMPEKWMSP